MKKIVCFSIIFIQFTMKVYGEKLVVTNNGNCGSGTLHQAAIDANFDDTITFDNSIDSIFTNCHIVIRKSISIISNKIVVIKSQSNDLLCATFVFNNDTSQIYIQNIAFVGRGQSIRNFSKATIKLFNCSFENILGALGGKGGGAIFNSGNLIIERTSFINNKTHNMYSLLGGHGVNGGAIYNEGNLVLTNCTFWNNSTSNGGDGKDGDMGICYGGPGNDGGNGGNGGDGANGGDGGAIFNTGSCIITNCTFSSNSTGKGGNGGKGGSGGQCPPLFIYDGTPWTWGFVVNGRTGSSGSNGKNGKKGLGDGIYSTKEIIIRNSIINDTIYGPFFSKNFNIIINVDSAVIKGSTDYNLIGINPCIDSARNNGGFIKTCLLFSNSPAINAIITGNGAPDFDARGYLRDELPDIGSFEYNGVLPQMKGSEEFSSPKGIIFYPNPTNNRIEISFKFQLESNYVIEIVDLKGHVLNQVTKGKDETKVLVDMSKYQEDLYILRIYLENEIFSKKIIKLQ